MFFDGNCLIRRAGVTPDGRAQLDLSAEDGSFGWNWFLSPSGHTREILAVALAAIASNKRVFCQIQDPSVAWSDVIRFGLVK